MKILAIDPGPEQSAGVIWDVDIGRVVACKQMDNRLFRIFVKAQMKCGTFDVAAIEDVAYYGKVLNRSTFETLKFIGRLQEILHPHCHFVFFPDYALHFCNSRRGVKTSQINAVLTDRLGGKGTQKNPGPLYGIKEHMWSALAVAVYWADKYGHIPESAVPF